VDLFSFCSPILGLMATLPRKTSVVPCKECNGVPAQPVAVRCPLCGQRRMDRPVAVNLDRLRAAVLERGQG
jgi:hypothetical protein